MQFLTANLWRHLIVPTLTFLMVADAYAEGDASKSAESAAASSPLDPAIELAKKSRAELAKVDDYVATFYKKERVGDRLITHNMAIKHRRDPFSVYLRFIGDHEGREVIYADGGNDGKLLVHETGLAGIIGTIALIPTSPEAMSESLYPITSIGMWNLVEKVIVQWEGEREHGEVEVKYYPQAKLGKVECKTIESTHPKPRRHFRYHRTRLYLDKKTNLPVRVEQFGFPRQPDQEPPLVGEYQYSDVRINQGLRDIDFDPRNPKYNY